MGTGMAKPTTLVFDLDGTLADTAGDLVATLNAILAREGLMPLPLGQARDMIGAGARALIQRGFQASGRPLSPERLDQLFVAFLDHYREHLVEQTVLYDGVEAALDKLETDGYRFAVCTNKVEEHSVRLLDALGVSSRFAAICGRDSFAFFKPDPRHLTATVQKAGGDPTRAIMIGDSRTDIDTARAAGVPVIAVTFGYTDMPVATMNPDRLIDHFDELHEAVRAVAP
jgi:phosphoglycolate phosphatase